MDVSSIDELHHTTPLVPPPATDAAREAPDGPVLVMDLDVVQNRVRTLRAVLPGVTVLYAVKAHPAIEVVTAITDLAADFDMAAYTASYASVGLNGFPPLRCQMTRSTNTVVLRQS